jgi:glyoxylate reductase
MGPDVSGATLGLIGFGRIGREMARRAAGFRMRIIYYSPGSEDDPVAQEVGAQPVDFETVLRESDFVSLHVPLTSETRAMINADAFARMKPGAILINTARGPVVDTDALYPALQQGRIAHAALDVTDPEPIPADHPLLKLENLTIAPHIASASTSTRNRMADMAADNLLAGVQGKPLPHCVNPQVYERRG